MSLVTLSIATWNVNSINARLPNALAWLREAKPDVVLLQELKCVEDAFPRMEIEEMGYNLAIHGEKTYNGVAILSKYPIDEVSRGLPGEDADIQSRYIEAIISLPNTAIRVASIYVPNGQSPESDKFAYKLRFLERLFAHTQKLLGHEEMLVLGGDYNTAPFPEDVYDPKRLDGTTCYHPEERKRLRELTNLGVYDAFSLLHDTPGVRNTSVNRFSWWDYRGGSYERNLGMRIDHLLLSPQAADKLKACEIHSDTRAKEKASDHAPVVATFVI